MKYVLMALPVFFLCLLGCGEKESGIFSRNETTPQFPSFGKRTSARSTQTNENQNSPSKTKEETSPNRAIQPTNGDSLRQNAVVGLYQQYTPLKPGFVKNYDFYVRLDKDGATELWKKEWDPMPKNMT